MVDLSTFSELVPLDNGLCVLAAPRADGAIAASVVNAGVLEHPLTGEQTVGFVARGLRKLEHLRAKPRATIVVRAGWSWAAAEGYADIFGSDDPHPALDGEKLRLLLRQVFEAAGGTHDDWNTYDASCGKNGAQPCSSFPGAPTRIRAVSRAGRLHRTDRTLRAAIAFAP